MNNQQINFTHPQIVILGLCRSEFKHEVGREAVGIAFYRLDEGTGSNAIELSQVMAEHDLMAANEEDAFFQLQPDFRGYHAHI